MNEHFFEYNLVQDNEKLLCSFKIKGKMTHKDYKAFVPDIENKLSNYKDPKIKILVDITEFKGWDLEAAWDDLRFSLKHSREFEKIAVIGHNNILELSSKVALWFLPYEAKFFDDEDSAKQWLFE